MAVNHTAGPCWIEYEKGSMATILFTTETFNDWQETPLGLVNFGFVKCSPVKYVVAKPSDKPRKWWRIWNRES